MTEKTEKPLPPVNLVPFVALGVTVLTTFILNELDLYSRLAYCFAFAPLLVWFWREMLKPMPESWATSQRAWQLINCLLATLAIGRYWVNTYVLSIGEPLTELPTNSSMSLPTIEELIQYGQAFYDAVGWIGFGVLAGLICAVALWLFFEIGKAVWRGLRPGND